MRISKKHLENLVKKFLKVLGVIAILIAVFVAVIILLTPWMDRWGATDTEINATSRKFCQPRCDNQCQPRRNLSLACATGSRQGRVLQLHRFRKHDRLQAGQRRPHP